MMMTPSAASAAGASAGASDDNVSYSSGTSGSVKAADNSSHNSSDGNSISAGSSSNTSDNGSSTTGSSGTSFFRNGQNGNNDELGARETKYVDRSRAVFMVVLLSIATAAAALTFIFISKEEEKDFQNEFYDYVAEIESVSENNALQQYNVLKSLALSVTTLAMATNATWTQFSMADFHVQAEQFLKSTGCELLTYAPVLLEDQVQEWEEYSVLQQWWYEAGLYYEDRQEELCCISDSIPHSIHQPSWLEEVEEQDDITHFLPLWQTFPTPTTPDVVNYNLVADETFNRLLHFLLETGQPALSEVVDPLFVFGDGKGASFYRAIDSTNKHHDHSHPHSLLIQPVTADLKKQHDQAQVVAVLTTVLPWDLYFTNVLHEGANGLVCVVSSSCGDSFTYQINGNDAIFLGYGDHHSAEYEQQEYHGQVEFEPFPWHTEEDDTYSNVNCHYSIDIYPAQILYDEYHTNRPMYLTIAVCVIFAFTSLSFVVYDRLVQIRQAKILDTAQRTNAIVASLFPAEFRDRLFRKKGKGKKKDKKQAKKMLAKVAVEGPKFRLKNFLHEEHLPGSSSAAAAAAASSDSNNNKDYNNDVEKQPIADLFPNTTVMFADISGFTAWSSTREPAQVFTLLETVYRAFDHVAKRRRVFKVETIGDCYVAVAGLPEPRKDHAIVMARFARECLAKMGDVTKKLEVTLGPDTGELEMRFGLHSGPVTAGVLRGEKSRFQLFGDTVNTAARMESTGKRSKIHVSQETADLLIEGGKGKWVEPREEKIVAKGKGELQTFWVHAKDDDDHHSSCSDGPFDDIGLDNNNHKKNNNTKNAIPCFSGVEDAERNHRLVGWMTEVLTGLLKQLVAARQPGIHRSTQQDQAIRALELEIGKGHHVLEEMPEYVPLPEHEVDASQQCRPEDVKLDHQVTEQLRQYVAVIASMYKHNPFHCFEHATHVTMSVRKLLSRIVSPENPCHGSQFDSRLSVDDKTYGITADKMAQFAVVFCALIHDVDHRGIPNFCLVKEDEELSARYNGKAIAEQNSLDLAWSILMSPDFAKLRACIYTTKEEFLRFRQLLVNTIIATDIFDPDLAKRRLDRWQKAFEDTDQPKTLEDVSRKSTIVIEHLIQASDVAHTMQHWQVYVKWNERLFEEMYTAFKQGRFPKDPSVNWYYGELGFFDNYVIPLAKKLDDCGVFGVSSDEYLNYALQNRAEWSNRGNMVVEELKQKVEEKVAAHDDAIHEA